MKIYGISLTNLIHRAEKRADICVQIGKCFRDGDNHMFVEIHRGNDEIHESDESAETVESDESDATYYKSASKKRLLGANNKCTYGPSYWCSSEETMNECNVRH